MRQKEFPKVVFVRIWSFYTFCDRIVRMAESPKYILIKSLFK